MIDPTHTEQGERRRREDAAVRFGLSVGLLLGGWGATVASVGVVAIVATGVLLLTCVLYVVDTHGQERRS